MAPLTSWALSALLFASSAIAIPSPEIAGRGPNPTVSIDAGRIIGTTTTLPAATGAVNQFLGIPYAAPPVRFEKSVKPAKWRLPKTVQNRGKSCIQQFNYPAESRAFTQMIFSNPPPQESEDCLFLNVFAPTGKAPDGGFPVMFWIYGGALQFGNGGQPGYDGSWLAGFEDVVVVTINYRTNVFGFPASPELALTNRNLGFYDQRLALSWVQTNIGAFNGNPRKVTIFGESAGALSVDALITSSRSNPPFRAAILQSGQASLAKFIGRTNSTTAWLSLAEKVNCTTAASPLACIKKVDPLVIKDTIERNMLGFNPVLDNVTFVSDPTERRAARNIANVPIMVGSNKDEGRVFNVGQTDLNAYLTTTFQVPALINAIKAAYPLGTPGLETEYDAISAIFTDFVFTCPASGTAIGSAAAGYDTYRYFYTPTFPNINPALAMGIDLKAFHSAEIPMAFGTYPKTGVTAQQEALSKYMRGAWAGFARNPAQGPGWNKLGTFNGTDLGVLGLAGSAGVTVTPRAVADARCALFAPVYAIL